MRSSPNTVLDASARPFPFHYVVAGITALGLAVALFAALGVAAKLAGTSVLDPRAWSSLPAGLLDPSLLALLASAASLSALSLWIVARYEHRLAIFAESRARNRAIVDNMLDGAIHIDAAGRVAGLNAAAERIFGYGAEALQGQPFSLLFASPQRERLEEEMQGHPDQGLPPSLVGRHRVLGRRRDGEAIPLSLALTEVHVGGYLVYTAVVRDATG